MAGTGGYRPGAGRKPNKVKRLEREIASEALTAIDELEAWKSILTQTGDLRLKFDALKYLTDRVEGKAADRIKAELTGKDGAPLEVAIRFVDGGN